MLTFDFPPIGGVAVERALRFVRLLPGNGWMPEIVTIRKSPFFPHDSASVQMVPRGVAVIRTRFIKVFLPISLTAQLLPRAWRLRFKNWFAFPDFYVGWLPFLIPTIHRLLEGKGSRGRYDALYSTSPPPSVHLAASWAKRRYGIPWVADFRDPWIGNPILRPPTPAHRAFHAALERRVIADADVIIANTEKNRESLKRRYPLHCQKIHLIPNGYDEEEFASLGHFIPHNEYMTICHAGTLFPHYDPGPLFSALASLVDAIPETRRTIRVKLFGSQSEHRAVERYRLRGIIEEYAWCPRSSLLRELAASDVLLLCMSGSKATDFWVPAKTYTYLKLGKPVLALVPEGEARQILQAAEVGIICEPNDVSGIKKALLQLYGNWKCGMCFVSPNWEFIQRFEGQNLAARLSRALDGIGGEVPPELPRSSVPDAAPTPVSARPRPHPTGMDRWGGVDRDDHLRC